MVLRRRRIRKGGRKTKAVRAAARAGAAKGGVSVGESTSAGKRGGSRAGAGKPPNSVNTKRTEATSLVPPATLAPRTHLARGGSEAAQEDLHMRACTINAADQQHRLLQTVRSREKQRKDERVVALEAEVKALREKIAELAPAAPEPNPVKPNPVSSVEAVTDPDPDPDPEPKYRKCVSGVSKKRAARRLRNVLCEYPPADRPDLLARVIVADGRGKGCGISVSLVKELLATPRMARHMKEHAEVILAEARTHMMQKVFSASNLTTARRLLRLTYRKLEWLRRLLSHDGKKPRVMHPQYATHAGLRP